MFKWRGVLNHVVNVPTMVCGYVVCGQGDPTTNCGDYFSIDYYMDTGEPEYYKQFYAALGLLLQPGQGFFMVPGKPEAVQCDVL